MRATISRPTSSCSRNYCLLKSTKFSTQLAQELCRNGERLASVSVAADILQSNQSKRKSRTTILQALHLLDKGSAKYTRAVVQRFFATSIQDCQDQCIGESTHHMGLSLSMMLLCKFIAKRRWLQVRRQRMLQSRCHDVIWFGDTIRADCWSCSKRRLERGYSQRG